MTRKNPLVEVLEKVFWAFTLGERDGVVVLITHRGAPGDVKSIKATDIARFDRGYIHVLADEDDGVSSFGGEVPIPLHRVLQIVDAKGTVLYVKGTEEKEQE